MKYFSSLVVMLLLSCCSLRVTAQTHGLMYEQLLRPPDAVYHSVPIGLCEDYPEESTTMAIIRSDMELMKRSGIRVLRVSFGWDGIEAASGKYNWLFWDDFVKTAVDEYGITLVPYVCYTPAWNSTGDTSNYWNHTPKNYEAFGPFMEALVTRYKQWIRTWEIWNEPDIDAYWSGTAEDIARLTKIGAIAVRRADPTAKIVLAGLAHKTEFTRALFRDYGISPYVDVVNCHSYYETWSNDPLEQIPEYVNTIAEIIRNYGNHQSLWMAEVGYSTYRKPDGSVSDSYRATYAYEHTPAYQAVALWRTITLLLSTDQLAAIAWYEIKDLPPAENVIGDANNRNLGVATVGHVAKPAERALTSVDVFFRMPHKSLDRETMVRRSAASESIVHTFSFTDGSVGVVAWLKTHVRGATAAGQRGTLADGRSETIEVSVPFKGAAVLTSLDVLGTIRSTEAGKTLNGRLVIPSLVLKGGEIVIYRITPR